MAVLNSEDIISKDAIMAPMVLVKNLEAVLVAQDNIVAKSKEMSAALGSGASTDKVKKSIQDLTVEQKEQLKVMDAISKESAKNTDSYRAAQLALQKLKDENKLAVATQDSWTKSVTAANSSLIQLEQALNKNRIAYGSLRTEQERNGKAGKELLTVIQAQDKSVKSIRDSMGQAQAHVGGYREEIEKLIPALRTVAPEAVEAGEAVVSFGSKLISIALSPVVLAVTAVVAVFTVLSKAVEAYTHDTIEGADSATTFAEAWKSSTAVVENRFKDLGREVHGFWENQKQAALDLSILIGAVFTGKFREVYEQIKKAHAQATENAIVVNALRKEEIVLITEIAEAELEKNNALFDSRDKLRKSEQDRFEAALKVREEIQKEVDLKLKSNDLEDKAVRGEIALATIGHQKLRDDQKAADIFKDQALYSEIGYELAEKLAKVEARRLNIQAELSQGQRRSNQTLNSVLEDVTQRNVDADKAGQDAIIKSREATYKSIANINQRIISNQEYTVEQQVEAQKQLSQSLVGLVDLGASKELAAAKEAAIKRIKLTSDESDAIFNLSEGEVDKLAELTLAAKEAKLATDKEYQSQSIAITESAAVEREKITAEEGDKIGNIIVENGKYWIDLRKRLALEDTNAELELLNKKFVAGEVGVVAYEKQKIEIQKEANARNSQIELEGYKESIDNLITQQAVIGTLDAEGYKKLAELRKLYTEAELAATEKDAERKVAIYKKVKAETIKIVSELGASIQELADTQYEADVAASEARLNLLDREHERALQAAGNNANAKAAIDREYTRKFEAETQKQNAIKRKQAQLDKVAATFKIISSTAAGIAQAYEDFPYPVATVFAVLIGAVAALQLASVASAPLPSYREGTGDHPGGLAVVGHGLELVREPGRKPFLVSSPEVMDLARHTEVLTEGETVSALAAAGLSRSIMSDRQIQPVIIDTKAIAKEIAKLQQPDLFEQMGEVYKAFRRNDGSKRVVRVKWRDR